MDKIEMYYLINIVVGYYLYEKRPIHQEGHDSVIIPYSKVRNKHILKIEIFMYILSNLLEIIYQK